MTARATGSRGQKTAPYAVQAGLDEAGYGPMLGPLTLGFSAFRTVGSDAADWTADWARLADAVSGDPKDDRSKLVVADSKRVFTRNPRGAQRLEASALAFLRAAGSEGASAADLLQSAPKGLGVSDAARAAHPWYAELPSVLPCHVDAVELARREDALSTALETSRTEVAAAGAVVIPAGELNDSFAATGNKGATHWSYSSRVVLDLFERFGAEGLDLTVDRLGGRARYGAQLSALVPFSTVHVTSESHIESRYLVTAGDRRMRVRFVQKGDQHSLPVALGSCLAKYARELVMDAFNEHFRGPCPDVRPTAGYVTDARRWLADVERAAPSILQNRDRLVRTR